MERSGLRFDHFCLPYAGFFHCTLEYKLLIYEISFSEHNSESCRWDNLNLLQNSHSVKGEVAWLFRDFFGEEKTVGDVKTVYYRLKRGPGQLSFCCDGNCYLDMNYCHSTQFWNYLFHYRHRHVKWYLFLIVFFKAFKRHIVIYLLIVILIFN